MKMLTIYFFSLLLFCSMNYTLRAQENTAYWETFDWDDVVDGAGIKGDYGSVQAIRIAENVLLYQRECGGWPKNTQMQEVLNQADKNALIAARPVNKDCTIDNKAVRLELEYLSKVYKAIPDGAVKTEIKTGFLKGVQYLLDAQYDNGGWPQFYPLKDKGHYSRHITFNDGAMVNAMNILRHIYENDNYSIVADDSTREDAGVAFEKGVACILNSQFVQNGNLTVWCAQHHYSTLLPVKARSYELPSLSGGESAGIIELLMSVDNPSNQIKRAIRSAVSWYDKVAISGIRLEGFINSDGMKDRRVVEDPDADALWARFYTLENNTPYFCDRDGIVKYSIAEIGHERRNGYSWYTGSGHGVLEEYNRWLSRWGPVITEVPAPFAMSIEEISFPETYFSVKDFGAIEGGSVKCTEAFSEAIEKATSSGGGYVIVPKGKYLTGPIVLKDNVCLKFEEGVEILFSTDPDDYLPAVISRHQGIDCYKFSSFIYAHHATNIGIIGKAILHGQGRIWWDYRHAYDRQNDPWNVLVEMAETGVPLEERIFDDVHESLLAPCFVMPINCKNVLIEDITLKYGAYWTVNPVYCENVIIRGVSVETIGDYGKTGNGDGINLSSCRNVLVEHCTLNTGDDCITLKSGRGIDGYKKALPTENIVIRNCTSLQGHGGVVIGSETSGGVHNIYVHDCEFNGTDRGLRIKTARGRGEAIENIWFENIKMGQMVKEAIKIHMPRYTDRYPAHPLSRMTPRIRNVNYRNIDCKGAGGHAIRIQGLPEMPIESIQMENINVQSEKGALLIDAAAILIDNIEISTRDEVVFSFDNCSNITIENLEETDQKVFVRGEGSKDIRLIDCQLDMENILYEGCPNPVSVLATK